MLSALATETSRRATLALLPVSVMFLASITRRTLQCASHNTKPSRSFSYEIRETNVVGARALRSRRRTELGRERAERAGHAHEGGARVAGPTRERQGARRRAQADRDGSVRGHQDRPDRARSDRG